MSKRGLSLLLVLVFFSLSLSGCYYFAAKKEMKNAEERARATEECRRTYEGYV